MNSVANNFKNRLIEFTIQIVKITKVIPTNTENLIFSKQIIRSASSIGANYQEAQVSQSKKEFIAKTNISLKESNETKYWLEVIEKSNKINLNKYLQENTEIIKILTSIIKKANVKWNLYHVPFTIKHNH